MDKGIAYQTRIESLSEAIVNIVIGFTINFIANLTVLPLFGFHTLTLWKNFEIGLIFTVISVARQYVIRRWAQDNLRNFNKALAGYLYRVRYGQ